MADSIIKSLTGDEKIDKPFVEGTPEEQKPDILASEVDASKVDARKVDASEVDAAETPDGDEQESANLQLGDIIKIIAPADERIHEKLFYINYIDPEKADLIQPDGEKYIMHIEKDGSLRNKSIEAVEIMSRPDELGYARQHELLPGTWIDIEFGGDLPTIITGKIVNLEEDQIEVKTSDGEIIFLDFGYRGLPENIPIEKISIRDVPLDSALDEESKDGEKTEEEKGIVSEFPDDAESSAYVEDLTAPRAEKTELQQQIRDVLLQADQIIIGDALEEVSQVVDVPEHEQRFGIEKQTADLLDELLSTIPNHQRTESVLNNIHTIIERFKQLRTEYSTFDANNNALLMKTNGAQYKPLVNKLKNLSHKLYWILPVAQNKKKLYDLDIDATEEFDDIDPLTLAQVRSEEHDIIQQYMENDIPEGETGNHYLANALHKYLTPFVNSPVGAENIIEKHVQTNITAIIDNLGEFYSSVAHNDDVRRKRFLIQEYNLGLNTIQTEKKIGGGVVIKQKKLTPNDEIVLKSFLTLPEAAVQFSKINLPMTDIMTKSSLNRNFIQYWKLLTDKRIVNPIVIDNLDASLQYEDGSYLSGYKEFILDAGITEQTSPAEREVLFEKYLNTIIPKTRSLFNMVKANIEGKLSIHGILKYLEPFMIYQKDLSFKQYQEFTQFISVKINDYKKTYSQNVRDSAAWRRKYTKDTLPSIFAFIIAEYYTIMLSGYGFDSLDTLKLIGNSEFLNRVILTDSGRLYNTILAKISSTLMMNGGIEQLEQMEELSKENKAALAEDDACKKYILTKKYFAIDEMEDDNGKDIYFDKQYDKTYYSLIDDYADIAGDDTVPREEIIKTLQMKLKENIGLSDSDALRDATAMVDKKRIIVNGDYCVVINETENGPDMLYYMRDDNTWISADHLPEDIFTDKSKTFCNLNEKCLDISDTCETMEGNAQILQDKSIDNIVNEFADNLRVGADIIRSRIMNKLDTATARLPVLRDLAKNEEYKYNNNHILIGDTSVERDSVISPYVSLRDKILGQGDLAKRQADIGRFVANFTRPPGDEEDQWWLYCMNTDTKLLPSFLSKLATVFVENDNYLLAIERICAEQGTISDDGDNWVDKHSGYIITSIAFNNDEGYTETGFKAKSRELLDEELGNAIIQTAKSKHKYENKEAQKIFNVTNAMGKYTGIDISPIYEFIVSHSLDLLSKSMPKKEDYNAARDAAMAKGKKRETFEVAFHSSLIIITLCFFLVAVQTSIPSITTRKRYPGCTRSFTGYPITGIEDTTGLTYLSCVAFKIKSSVEPWNGIAGMGQKSIIKRVKSMLETYVTKLEIVQEKIAEKQEFLSMRDVEDVAIAHDITEWSTFLPPLRPIKIGVIENVTREFSDLFVSEIKSGAPEQIEKLDVMQSKATYYSLKIQSLIHNVVKKSTEILSLHNNEPLLENACCDSEDIHTLDYFTIREPEILACNNHVETLMNIVDDARLMAKASILFDARNTRLVYPALPTEFSEEIIYRAFIIFCKYNSTIPVSEELRAVCMEKPKEFDIEDSIENKIILLKKAGHQYSQEAFQQLMQIVNRQNIVHIDLHHLRISNIQQIRDMLYSLREREVGISPEFLSYYDAALHDYGIEPLMEDSAEMRALKNYLGAENDTMKHALLDFVSRANISNVGKPRMQRMFRECLEHISQFKETDNGMPIEQINETTFKMVQFMKNAIRNLSRVLPNIIINKVDNKAVHIPKHWKLSEKHEKDLQSILNKHYATLYKLYDDQDIDYVLQKVNRINRDIDILAELTEYYAPVQIGEREYTYSIFDSRMCHLLFTYYFLLILTNIKNMVDDEDVILRTLAVPLISVEGEDMSPSVSSIEEQNMGLVADSEIIQGEKKEISDKIASVIYVFVNIICSDKDAIDYTYEMVMEKVTRSKEKEKDSITNFLKEMTDEEREIENLFKNNKLEKWSKGLQKGVRIYQKDTYDDERNAMESQALAELRMGESNVVTDMNRNIYSMEHIDAQLSAEQIASEEMSIQKVVNDDDYGDGDGDEGY